MRWFIVVFNLGAWDNLLEFENIYVFILNVITVFHEIMNHVCIVFLLDFSLIKCVWTLLFEIILHVSQVEQHSSSLSFLHCIGEGPILCIFRSVDIVTSGLQWPLHLILCSHDLLWQRITLKFACFVLVMPNIRQRLLMLSQYPDCTMCCFLWF